MRKNIFLIIILVVIQCMVCILIYNNFFMKRIYLLGYKDSYSIQIYQTKNFLFDQFEITYTYMNKRMYEESYDIKNIDDIQVEIEWKSDNTGLIHIRDQGVKEELPFQIPNELDLIIPKYDGTIEIEPKDHTTAYRIHKNVVEVTYDHGEQWQKVPLEANEMASCHEFESCRNLLGDKSYYITPEKTIFLSLRNDKTMQITTSNDQGKTWETDSQTYDKKIRDGIIACKDTIGLIALNDFSNNVEIAISRDGGVHYERQPMSSTHIAPVEDAGIIDDNLMFLTSYYNEGNALYRSIDQGKTFEFINMGIPEKNIIVNFNVPYAEDNYLAMEVSYRSLETNWATVNTVWYSHDRGETWKE